MKILSSLAFALLLLAAPALAQPAAPPTSALNPSASYCWDPSTAAVTLCRTAINAATPVDRSGFLTTAATSQATGFVLNALRKGGVIQNPCTALGQGIAAMTSSSVVAPGINYAVNDLIGVNPQGGFGIVSAGGDAQYKVITTQLISATINAAGSGYTNGVQTFTGTSGTGTKFTVSINVASGIPTGAVTVVTAGSYTAQPTTTASATTGPGGSGLTLNLVTGVLTVTPTNAGQYSAFPPSPWTQSGTSGSGTGASFSFASTTLPESLFVNDVGTATLNSGNLAELLPCGALTLNFGATVNTAAITVNAATKNHRFSAREF